MPKRQLTVPPLDGIRVIDLCRDFAGAYATRLLADCGAEVVKIEPPGGEPLRAVTSPEGRALFDHINGGKRSVIIDVEPAEGQELLRALLLDCDLIVEDLPPGEMERLGLHYDVLVAVKPRLVHLSVTPFGLFGPLAGETATDVELLEAARLDLAGAGPLAARFRAGLHAFAAATTSLYAALVTEVGHQVEVAAIEALAATLPARARVAHAAGVGAVVGGPPFSIGDAHTTSLPAPLPGQHTEEVLFGELALDAEEFTRLRTEGVV